MLQVELRFPIQCPVYSLALTLNLPIVSTIAISLVAKSAYLLSAADRRGEVRMGVQVLAGVHVFQPDEVPALDGLAGAAGRRLVLAVGADEFWLLKGPEGVVVVVVVEASHCLLPTA